MMGETKTEAIRRALEERKQRLSFQVMRKDRKAKLHDFLAKEVWPLVPVDLIGRPLGREEEDGILGYGKDGI